MKTNSSSPFKVCTVALSVVVATLMISGCGNPADTSTDPATPGPGVTTNDVPAGDTNNASGR